MNFRDRLEQSRERQANANETASNAELEAEYSCDYFATDNIKSLPACLDLRLPDNKRKAIPYTHFVEIEFNSGTSIEITTTTKKIKISGRDLGKLFDYLVAYRVRYIQANLGAEIEGNGLFVKEINVEEMQ